MVRREGRAIRAVPAGPSRPPARTPDEVENGGNTLETHGARKEIPSLLIRLVLDQNDGFPAMRGHVADVAG